MVTHCICDCKSVMLCHTQLPMKLSTFQSTSLRAHPSIATSNCNSSYSIKTPTTKFAPKASTLCLKFSRNNHSTLRYHDRRLSNRPTSITGKQTLFTYSYWRSFSPICMAISCIFCCCWLVDCWIELWALYIFTLQAWPFSRHHPFRSSIKNETFSYCSISYYCHGIFWLKLRDLSKSMIQRQRKDCRYCWILTLLHLEAFF